MKVCSIRADTNRRLYLYCFKNTGDHKIAKELFIITIALNKNNPDNVNVFLFINKYASAYRF